jgi:hypothetical protein
MEDVDYAKGEIEGLMEEYAEWEGNLPENMQSSPVAEKLQEIANIDLTPFEDAMALADELANVDLPRGFGRD